MCAVARCFGTLVVAIAAASAVLVADDHVILTDTDVDYSTFKTFTVANPKITTERQELTFPALTKTLVDIITKTLTTSGLKETRLAQLTVETTITTVDYALGSFGRANVVRGGRTGPGGRQGAQVDFSEATIVIDLVRDQPRALVWRGVYRDTEDVGQKLADAVVKDTATLVAQFPPKKK